MRFFVNVTLEKHPTTLGENQFERSSLFLKIAFLQWKIFSKKSASKYTTYLISRASQQFGNYSKQDSNKWCTAFVLCAEKPANCSSIFVQTAPRKSYQNLRFIVCWISCTNLLHCCLGMCAKLLSTSPPCSEISLALLLSFSQFAHERIWIEWSFPPFPPLI